MAAAQSHPNRSRSPSPPILPRQDESTPLLHQSPTTTASPSADVAQNKPWVLTVSLAFLLIFVVDFGSYIAAPSLTRLYEGICCYKWYFEHDPTQIPPGGWIPEQMCKVTDVQDTVALLFGWQNVWDALPGIFLAIPYGSLADKWGRKKVAFLSFFGIFMNFSWIVFVCYTQLPLHAVWLSSLWLLVGGGPVVGASVLFTMASDVCPEEQRTTVFLWLSAAILLGEMLGPAVSNPLMKKSVWFPLVVSIAVVASAIVVLIFIPETMHYSAAKAAAVEDNDDEDSLAEGEGTAKEGRLDTALRGLRESWDFLFHDVNVALIMFSCASSGFGRQALQILLQYASKRYHWSIADAGLLGTLRASINLVLFLVVLPWVTMFMIRRLHLTSEQASLEVARWSALLMMMGFLVVGFSPNAILMIMGLIVYTIGTGFVSSMRSVAVALVGGDQSPHMAKLFSTMGVISALGSIVAGPLLPLAFHWGQEIGGMGLGLPFVIAGGLFGLTAILAFLVKLPPQWQYQAQRDEEGEAEER